MIHTKIDTEVIRYDDLVEICVWFTMLNNEQEVATRVILDKHLAKKLCKDISEVLKSIEKDHPNFN